MLAIDCERCDGTGFLVEDDGVASVARPCGCRRRPPTPADVVAAGLPRRYLHCTLDNYRPQNEGLQQRALSVARAFVEDYPAVGRGILFTGDCGTGKTHLAAAILRRLMLEQGVSGLFVDAQDLLKRIQGSWSRSGEGESESRVTGPALEAEILVLDDLGASRSTAWAEETLGHLLSVRYNEDRITLVTTNCLALEMDDDPQAREQLPANRVLLGDRVPERVLSRLHEMCRVVQIEGPDHRRRPAG